MVSNMALEAPHFDAVESVIRFHDRKDAVAQPVPGDMDLDARIARAEAALSAMLLDGHSAAVGFSAGKDSSTVLNLLLVTAAKLVRQGARVPPIVVTHADTLVESPEMVRYAKSEMVSVLAYARKHGLDVRVDVSVPNLTEQWSVRVIGGRALPTFPGSSRDCTVELKIRPQDRLRKKVMKELSARATHMEGKEPVILLGTRYDESAERARNMRERGESDVQFRGGIDSNGKPSSLFMSPIAFWDSDQVWEYLGTVKAGALEGYSDFKDTFRIYADSMGTSCAIVAEDMSKALKASKACGARTGCAVCVAVTVDKSMENMIAQPRYEYMAGLNRLRNFISNTRWDMDRRSWLGRTIKQGYVRISPDAYSPQMMEDLLKYALTIDADEADAARREGLKAPRFQLVGLEQLFAIDAMWSLQAYHRPFHAVKIWKDVHEDGERYPVPEVEVFRRPKEMPARFLHVGSDWEDGHAMAYTGLRSAVLELAKREGDGCMGTRRTSSGAEVMDIEVGSMLEFDVDAAGFVFDEDFSHAMEKHDDPRCLPTEAYYYYLQMGGMSIKSGMEAEVDSMLRRSNFKIRQGVDGKVDHKTLWERAVTAKEAGIVPSRNGMRRRPGAADRGRSIPTGRSLVTTAPAAPELPEMPEMPEMPELPEIPEMRGTPFLPRPSQQISLALEW